MDRPRRSDCTAGQMDEEAGWWTTSWNIGLPPLEMVMGVGRQQHGSGDSDGEGDGNKQKHNIHYIPYTDAQHTTTLQG